jgi:hypothetical protein
VVGAPDSESGGDDPATLDRRRLLAAGALAALAGCGKDQAAPVPPPAVDALTRQLAAERALMGALMVLPERAPRADRALVRRLFERSRERTRRLAVAARAEGGRLYDAPLRDDVTEDPEVVVQRARAAVVAHVQAMPSLRGRELRRLGAGLVTDSAADLALLGAVFGSHRAEAFPGTPA